LQEKVTKFSDFENNFGKKLAFDFAAGELNFEKLDR